MKKGILEYIMYKRQCGKVCEKLTIRLLRVGTFAKQVAGNAKWNLLIRYGKILTKSFEDGDEKCSLAPGKLLKDQTDGGKG